MPGAFIGAHWSEGQISNKPHGASGSVESEPDRIRTIVSYTDDDLTLA